MPALNNEVRGLRRPGYRFNPNDQELIKDYLFSMVYGNPPLSTDDVFNINVYGDHGYWRTLFELFHDEDTLYFFTRLTLRSENDSRIRRESVNGRWKNQHSPILIRDDDGEIIGSKGNFSFIPKEGVPEPSGEWVMHEYRLKGPYRNDEWALCRIRKKKGTNGMTAADANGRAADYGPPDDEEMSQMMMDLENIIRGDGQI